MTDAPDAPDAPDGPDADEYDKLRRRVLWKLPTGLYVIGARDGDRRNGMTISLVVQVSSSPTKLVAAAVLKEAHTHELLQAGGAFALSLLDREDRAIVRKFVKPVEVDAAAMTLNGFPFHDAEVTGAPILDQAVAWLDCRVASTVDCGDHTLFLGEVVGAGFLKDEATAVLRMEDTRMNYGG